MRSWNRGVISLCAAVLCLMAVGHATAFVNMSHGLDGTIDRQHAEEIRTVWLTVSIMFASFGLLLLRAAWRPAVTDWVVIVSIGAILTLAGSAGLIVSSGQPFWWQQIVLGAVISTIGCLQHRKVTENRLDLRDLS